jgi:hypothetical protein
MNHATSKRSNESSTPELARTVIGAFVSFAVAVTASSCREPAHVVRRERNGSNTDEDQCDNFVVYKSELRHG